MFVFFMAIGSILRPFGIFYGHLVDFVAILVLWFPRFGMLYQEKSGNPVKNKSRMDGDNLQRRGRPSPWQN
jgi:hypothetical protein